MGCAAGRWQGETTLRPHGREKEQRRQRPAARLNRLRSALTQRVKPGVVKKLNVQTVLNAGESGQLRFLGLHQFDKPPITPQRGVDREQGDFFFERLRHQQAIKRVAMHPGQHRDSGQMRGCDRQLNQTFC